MKTIHENERDHIVAVLKQCKGRVWGAGGAAEVLNVPPSTLKSKMKKLGIYKQHIE
jgi:transcriptional regulator with GAF, ATPase, and Fis domain